jgi:DNA-binding IscR family transcriptional regulator
MRHVRDAIASVLDQTTLEEACRKQNVESLLSYDI